MLFCTNVLCWWKYVVIGTYSLTFGAHVQKGYGTCLVCVCVYLSVCVCLLPLQRQHRSFLHSE